MKEYILITIIIICFAIIQVQHFTLKYSMQSNRNVITETISTLKVVADYAYSLDK